MWAHRLLEPEELEHFVPSSFVASSLDALEAFDPFAAFVAFAASALGAFASLAGVDPGVQEVHQVGDLETFET